MLKKLQSKLSAILTTAALMSAMSIASSQAKLTINERTQYYNVSGSTGKELLKSIVRRGPKTKQDGHAIATTQTKLKIVNIKVGIRGNRCVVEKLDIRLDLKYTLPRWKGSRKTSKKFARNWERFLVLVEKHEATHGRISREYARKLHARLSRLSGGVSRGCSDFGNFSQRSIRLAQEHFASRHISFDRREGSASSRIRRLQSILEISR